MGVHGLWRLIEPSGKPVPLETLENKVLAVDVSIWLHQAIKGFQDSRGAPLPNAHLLGIYHRVCKLLYFKIKPIFVFDGGVPVLKKQTIVKRNQLKSRNQTDADKLQKQLISTLLKHTAITNVLSEKTKASISPTKKQTKSTDDAEEDLFSLPSTQLEPVSSSSDNECTDATDESAPSRNINIHNIDTESKDFKALPADVRYEILSEVKETRKQSSWGRIREMPTKSDDFALYQMGRLLQRQNVQSELEKTEKEMGGHSLSLGELESLMKDQGVIASTDSLGKRIASDENTRFLLIKDVKQAIEEAKKNASVPENDTNEDLEERESETKSKSSEAEEVSGKIIKNKADLEYEESLHKAIALSMSDIGKNTEASEIECNDKSGTGMQEEQSTKDSENVNEELEEDLQKAIQLSLECVSEKQSENGSRSDDLVGFQLDETFDLTQITEVSDSEDDEETKKLLSAQRYMQEYSGLTPHEIAKIIRQNCDKAKTHKNVKPKKLVKHNKSNQKHSIPTIEQRGQSDKAVEKEHTSNEQLISKKALGAVRETGIEIMSDSESSDEFIEVEDTVISKSPDMATDKSGNKIEITIKPDEAVEDDLFSDIFTEAPIRIENEESNRNEEKEKITGKKLSEDMQDEALEIHKQAEELEEKPDSTMLKQNSEELQIEKDLVVIKEMVDEKKEAATSLSSKSIRDRIEEQLFKLHAGDVPAGEEDNEKTETRCLLVSDKSEKEPMDTEVSNEDQKEDADKSIEEEVRFPKLTVSDLEEIKEGLRKEQFQLQTEKSLKERLAGNLTDQMYQEAQELLELFGVPYIIAPMEAEAQCAFLDEINLTDGTITDDSDIWLFGGKTVYKNFFNQGKHVMEFRAENILHHFKLTRQQMILLALLVGSDYTVGIQGIGPVTALEILAAFPPSSPSTEFSLMHSQLLSGLAEFRNWFSKGKTSGLGRMSLRSKLKNVKFTENFPNVQVLEAYLEPKVETSREKFSWAPPDIVALTDFARQKFGWTVTKSEEILKPVIKRMEERHSQKTIKDYFKTKTKIISNEAENKMSKRVKAAVKRIGNEPEEEEPKQKQKRTRRKKNDGENNELGEGTSRENTEETKKPKRNTRGMKKKGEKDDELKELASDEDVMILQAATSRSAKRVKQINEELANELERNQARKAKAPDLHKKEIIPQKERDKNELLRNKLKAVEIFRKSQKGPGFVKKRTVRKRAPKEDAGLSEPSSDEN